MLEVQICRRGETAHVDQTQLAADSGWLGREQGGSARGLNILSETTREDRKPRRSIGTTLLGPIICHPLNVTWRKEAKFASC
jgi:hypothetical protein